MSTIREQFQREHFRSRLGTQAGEKLREDTREEHLRFCVQRLRAVAEQLDEVVRRYGTSDQLDTARAYLSRSMSILAGVKEGKRT